MSRFVPIWPDNFNDGRPFAAGSLVGLRTFLLNGDGHLHGPTYPARFDPGVNDAHCLTGSYAGGLFMSFIGAGVSADLASTLRPTIISQEEGHVVGGIDCRCGFYAYTDGRNDYQHGLPFEISAIVEGFGVCTVGNRGFRASKARLVALVDPNPRSLRRTWVWALLLAWALIAAVYSVIVGDWGWALANLATATLDVWVLRYRCRRRARNRAFELTRHLYPDVPVYRSEKAAVAAHPLTVREDQAGERAA